MNCFIRFCACAMVLASWVLAPRAALGDFVFVHASDTHFGAGENHLRDAELFDEIQKRTPRPAFVVTTGDICEYGTDAEYEMYRQALKSLGDVKHFPTPGNHDVRWNPRGKEGYTRGTGRPLYESWDHENVHFVTLDSCVLLEHWGHISQESLNWLAEDLKKVGPDRPVVIGFHHWIGRETIQVDNEQKLLAVTGPYNVVLWLQGHGHSDIQWNVNGAPATMVKGLYQGSYNIVEVSATEMKITRRFVPDPKKKPTDELVRDKSVPDEKIAPRTRHLMTIPLKKRPAPEWSATATREGDEIIVKATAPPGATLEYRVNTDKPQPLDGSARIPTTHMVAGDHVITVQATLADKRAYQIPVPVTLAGVTAAWQVNVGGEVQSRLVRAGDLLYVSSMGNDLVALDAASGEEKFRVRTGGPIFSACHVDGDTVYFGSADHHVYAVNARTGEQKWKCETGGAVLAGPNVAKGIACVGTTDTKIYGIDAATGSVVWTVPGKNMFQSKTATDGERFFVGGWDNHFRAIDARSGEVAWDLVLGKKQRYDNFSAFAPAITSPAVGNGKVFVSTNDGILHALSTKDGAEAWQIDWKKMGYSSPLFHDGKVYCALSDEGKVFCVNADTGKFIWTTPTGSVIYDSSFCHGGTGGGAGGAGKVFIANVNGTLNALDAATGKIDWQYRMGPGHLLGSPTADEAKVYMGSMSGKVIALPVEKSPATAAR
ncbi:MAG TPA: PQQ-binding-like beta-propeller repeat protein [Tepidisphaeraceae bacterium]|nr:PQQ-binding-like beta-propeller repeat protein [Tepidisphaeraceae bacterium]